MIRFLFLAICFCVNGYANATVNAVNVDNSTVHVYEKSVASPTILYIPGCSGLDSFGRQYQSFHLKKFKETWPEANIVVSQYVNDITQGSADGRCDWNGNDPRLKNRQSWHQAEHTIKIAEWIKTQSWSNGEVHLFAYSWGGRVGIWIPGSEKGKAGVFKSVALIWPDCRPAHKIRAGSLHTPTRIWATENDPLSVPKNCPNYYVDDDKKLVLSLYPGETHSWFDGPFFQSFTRWWPVQKVWVRHEYNEDWTRQTFLDWKNWSQNLP